MAYMFPLNTKIIGFHLLFQTNFDEIVRFPARVFKIIKFEKNINVIHFQ